MIISVSRRTDIPSYYSEWLFNRLNAGYAYVRNPMNPHRISEVSLSPDVVDGIVFWTKNPTPMLNRLHELQDYTYYFQFTLTPYGADVEKNIPSKNDIVIPTFQKLSSMIGKERVVWRYDPILLNDKYTMQYHMKYFRVLCDKLADHTEKCTISFLDLFGYSIRPSERRKGYATSMLNAILPYCREIGLDKLLITCIDGNIGSEKTIRNNGGVYESTVYESGKNCSLKRFWITL